MSLQIQLTPEEVQILDKAVDLWVNESSTGGLMASFFSAMLTPKDKLDEHRAFVASEKERCEREAAGRRLIAARLKLKLLEAAANPSEFGVDHST